MNKDMNKEMNKDTNKDMNKDINKDTNKGINKETGKNSGRDPRFPEIDYRATAEKICRICREKGVQLEEIMDIVEQLDDSGNFYRWKRNPLKVILTTEGLVAVSQLVHVPISELLVLKYPENM